MLRPTNSQDLAIGKPFRNHSITNFGSKNIMIKNSFVSVSIALASVSSFAQFPDLSNAMKSLNNAVQQQTQPANPQAAPTSVPTPAPAAQQTQKPPVTEQSANIKVTLGNYVGTYNGKKFKDNYLIVKKVNETDLVFILEAMSDRGSSGSVTGTAKRKDNGYYLKDTSYGDPCEIQITPNGNELKVSQQTSCGMGAGASSMETYVLDPSFVIPSSSAPVAKAVAVQAKPTSENVKQIPAEIHGNWGQDTKDCKLVGKAGEYLGFTVDRTMVQFAFSSCTVKKNAKFDGKTFSASYICASEGEENPYDFTISILDSKNITLKDKEGTKKFMRCMK